MIEQVNSDPAICRRLRSGSLGAYLDTFVAAQIAEGFARTTIQEHLRVVGALGRWMTRRRLGACDLNEARIQEFVRSRHHRPRFRRGGRPALAQLLGYLRGTGAVSPPQHAQPDNAAQRVAQEFERHLLCVQGCAHSTAVHYARVVHRFLNTQFGSHPVRLRALHPEDVRSFLLDAARRRSRTYARGLVKVLRSFFRWLMSEGMITRDLASFIPGVACWRLRSVPTTLTAAEVSRVIGACDRGTALGQRDYAILMLLGRLGLRAGAVVALTLDDIDWRSGLLTVHGKAGWDHRLPLPPDVGKALMSYLRNSRPPCHERRLFVCMNAPHRGFANASVVSSIVSQALRRAGMNLPHQGAHVLRHSLATTLLRRGATLAEIGDTLGHRCSASTEIYAKVDFEALRTVVQPWPGGEQ